MTKTLAERGEAARRACRVSLRDLGYTLTATGTRNFELTHASGGGCGWSGDYHPDVATSVRTYLQGVEAGHQLARRGVEKTSATATGCDGEVDNYATVGLHAAGFADAFVTQTGGSLANSADGDARFITGTRTSCRGAMRPGGGFAYDTAKVEDEGYTEDQVEVYLAEDIDVGPMVAALVAYRTREGL
jgi:hypothetical protein